MAIYSCSSYSDQQRMDIALVWRSNTLEGEKEKWEQAETFSYFTVIEPRHIILEFRFLYYYYRLTLYFMQNTPYGHDFWTRLDKLFDAWRYLKLFLLNPLTDPRRAIENKTLFSQRFPLRIGILQRDGFSMSVNVRNQRREPPHR